MASRATLSSAALVLVSSLALLSLVQASPTQGKDNGNGLSEVEEQGSNASLGDMIGYGLVIFLISQLC